MRVCKSCPRQLKSADAWLMIQIQFFWYAAYTLPCTDEIVRASEKAPYIWCEIIAIQWDNLLYHVH